jgi:hypothetical protein
VKVPPKPTCNHCGAPKPAGRGRKLCDACSARWQHQVSTKRCFRCGGPCAPQKILCAECKELAEWKRRTRHRSKRKPCVDCGGPKPPGQRRRVCDRCLKKRAEVPRCRCCGVRPVRQKFANLCVECKREAEQRLRERRRARNAEYRKQRKVKRGPADPETHRMGNRLRAEQAGRWIEPVAPEVYARRYGTGRGARQPHLPADPLLPLLADVFDPGAIAEAAGLSDSFVERIIHGRIKAVAVPDADRLCIALGLPLTLVYPDAV